MNYGFYKGLRSYFTESPKSRDQYRTQAFLSGYSPFHHSYYSYRDSMAYMDDYMNSRGISWDSIKYASMTPGWNGGQSAGSTMASVSRNFMSLYKSSSKKGKGKKR